MLSDKSSPDHGKVDYEIFNPDNTLLLDLISSQHSYQGQLWQSGDHIVEVFNRGPHSVDYRTEFAIR